MEKVKKVISLFTNSIFNILTILFLFSFSSCDLMNTKDLTELDKIQAAIETFRADVSISLTEAAKIANMDIEEKSFVFVSPYGTYTSPIVLSKGLERFTTEDFASGKNVLLSFFNLPEKSDIPSGFYKVYLYKDDKLNRWKFNLTDLNNNVIFNSLTAFREAQFNVQNNLANRWICFENNKILVNFGFTTKNHTLSNLLTLSIGTPSDDSSKDGRKKLKSLKLLREQVEPVLSSTTIEKLSKQVLIITRDDKTAIVSAFENTTSNPDTSINTLYLYLKSRKIPAGFYTIAIKNSNEKYIGYLLNEKKEKVSELNASVNFDWKGDDMGVVGGILENQIHLSFVRQISSEKKVAVRIIINDLND
ncbi:MAG: hypothetical protein N2319_01165 [Candidatus Kapabacteria bacterium]|nr:hypothetical protein [Candidatus Kapabacteria bacterium]